MPCAEAPPVMAETLPVTTVRYLLKSVPHDARLVAANDACLRRLRDAVDRLGPDAELRSDQVFFLGSGVRIEVIRRSRTKAVIRVLDGPHAGRTGVTIPEMA